MGAYDRKAMEETVDITENFDSTSTLMCRARRTLERVIMNLKKQAKSLRPPLTSLWDIRVIP
jgi:hypothetical protein